ncbi:uncharacterized protein K460DRAFT_370964 [Cucurbitaria berberidis CBS 394.84]|uniref:Amino acid transporter transmembrane domain-containing protein n=1 Tax=Cucurbitaria berberidis CBS 394.84 TaxID=1168544 RepID=A0A9P4G952_9PLEO|nr:uncharacterized protein K460DRAFT_370964 [Cucurbitaria berberidis CBS 394.84]KAF1840984.1 hypothetical protein K460DRAFT_370964 [Cucurbitaria berberidis CBS 394.84]
MALGLFGSKKAAHGAADRHSTSSDEKEKVARPDKAYDAEAGLGRIEDPSRRDVDEADSITIGKQIELEAENAIKYRTCSWPKTAALLFSEYICLAIMSFPWSYSILGLVPGLILTAVIAGLVLYTSLITWEFCLRHPEIRDVCDLGQMIFWNKKWAFYLTAVMFLLNNTFIMGLHCLVGAKWFNTISGHATCTIAFSVITAIISFLASLPRTFSGLAKIATFSALFTFISVMLAAIFSGIEQKPAGYPSKGEPNVLAFPASGTTFVAGMSAFMNISYTFIGQITLPSFIAEMKNPKDFPKALWVVTICEIIVFSLVGGVVYGYTGTQYMTSPAFGSLKNEVYKKVAFTFMVPTIIFLGVLYASVSARFVFFRIFAGTRHMGSHTVVGWATWASILAVLWILAFIIAEVIPFFSDLLSLMSSLFDSFFGFIFWGVAYFRLRRAKYGPDYWKTRGFRGYFGFFFNILLCMIGLLFLTGGTYATVQSIIDGYKASSFGGPFTCADNGL